MFQQLAPTQGGHPVQWNVQGEMNMNGSGIFSSLGNILSNIGKKAVSGLKRFHKSDAWKGIKQGVKDSGALTHLQNIGQQALGTAMEVAQHKAQQKINAFRNKHIHDEEDERQGEEEHMEEEHEQHHEEPAPPPVVITKPVPITLLPLPDRKRGVPDSSGDDLKERQYMQKRRRAMGPGPVRFINNKKFPVYSRSKAREAALRKYL